MAENADRWKDYTFSISVSSSEPKCHHKGKGQRNQMVIFVLQEETNKKQTKNKQTFKPDGSDLKEGPSLVSLPITKIKNKHAETQSRHFGITSKILKILTINHLGNPTRFGCLNPTKNKVKI